MPTVLLFRLRHHPGLYHPFWKNESSEKRAITVESSSIWSAPTCLLINPHYAAAVSKRFPLFLHESRFVDAGNAVRDDAPRKELHREFAILWFLRGSSGGGGEGGGLLVPVGAGTRQEIRRAGPGDRRVERHRPRAHATCMIWFVCFIFHISV